MTKDAFKILTKTKNSCQGLTMPLNHGCDVLTLGAEAATLVVWNFPWHWRKSSHEYVCQQTSPKQKESRISCWRPKERVMSRTSQFNLKLALALSRKQDLPTNHQGSACPLGLNTLLLLPNSNNLETSHWTQALNIKTASWPEVGNLDRILYHVIQHTFQYSTQPMSLF